MKRKRIGSILMAAVLMAVSLAATPLVARAEDHTNPKTGLLCNNTYRRVEHTGYLTTYQAPAHRLSDGRDCIPTRLLFFHNRYCTGCGALIDENDCFACEEWHSLCGTVIRGQGH